MSERMNKPIPPRKPEPYECCGTGCIPCVMDIYEEELWQFEKDMTAWKSNNPESNPEANPE
jgi:hypothetical protein